MNILNENSVKAGIDFNFLLDAVINDISYDDIFYKEKNARSNLLDYPWARMLDRKIKLYIRNLNNKGVDIHQNEEDIESFNGYKSISVNRNISKGKNKFKICLSPSDKNIYLIILEMIKKSTESKSSLYLSYTREDVLEKVNLYVKDEKDLNDKLKMLSDINDDSPFLFKDSDKNPMIVSSTSLDGVCVEAIDSVKRHNYRKFLSYNTMFNSALMEMKTLLYFYLGKTFDEDVFQSYDRNSVLNMFKGICVDVLSRYGLLIYFDDDKLERSCSNSFPGDGKCLNHKFYLNNEENVLEYGVRISGDTFRFYDIPFEDRHKYDIFNNLDSYDRYNCDISSYESRHFKKEKRKIRTIRK